MVLVEHHFPLVSFKVGMTGPVDLTYYFIFPKNSPKVKKKFERNVFSLDLDFLSSFFDKVWHIDYRSLQTSKVCLSGSLESEDGQKE